MSTYTAQRHADDEEAEHHQQNGLEVQQRKIYSLKAVFLYDVR